MPSPAMPQAITAAQAGTIAASTNTMPAMPAARSTNPFRTSGVAPTRRIGRSWIHGPGVPGYDAAGDAIGMARHLANLAVGESAGDQHERQKPEEHPAPAHVIADECGERRPGDARHDPRGREDREHPGPQRLGEGAPDDDVC